MIPTAAVDSSKKVSFLDDITIFFSKLNIQSKITIQDVRVFMEFKLKLHLD
jgi:hypothetical protein